MIGTIGFFADVVRIATALNEVMHTSFFDAFRTKFGIFDGAEERIGRVGRFNAAIQAVADHISVTIAVFETRHAGRREVYRRAELIVTLASHWGFDGVGLIVDDHAILAGIRPGNVVDRRTIVAIPFTCAVNAARLFVRLFGHARVCGFVFVSHARRVFAAVIVVGTTSLAVALVTILVRSTSVQTRPLSIDTSARLTIRVAIFKSGRAFSFILTSLVVTTSLVVATSLVIATSLVVATSLVITTSLVVATSFVESKTCRITFRKLISSLTNPIF